MRVQRTIVLTAVAGLALSALVIGCQGAKKSSANDEVPSAGLARFSKDATAPATSEPRRDRAVAPLDIASMTKQSALDLEALRSRPTDTQAGPSADDAAMGAVASEQAPQVGLRRASRPGPAAMPVSRGAATEGGSDPVAAADSAWATYAGIPETAPKPAPADPVKAAIPAMAACVREVDLRGSNPFVAGAVLASLETMRPGAMGMLSDEHSELHRSLSPADVAALVAARDALFSPASTASAAAPVDPDLPLKLGTTTFCTRVDSFGKYTPVTQDAFPANTPLRFLVYTEVEKFADRATDTGERAVELSQALTLFQDATGAEIWSIPAQSVLETSRRVRRDFYLVQAVDLPQNLTLGTYTLKVTVTDLTTKAVAEQAIRFSIAAPSRSALARPQ